MRASWWTHRKQLSRITAFVLVALIAVTLSGCPAQFITLVIPGDFSRFTDVRVQISEGSGSLLDHPGEFTADGATIRYSGSTGSQILLILTLETDTEVDTEGQQVKERQVAQGAVPISGAQVQLNGIGEDGPLDWSGRYHVFNGEVTALFPYDPCEVFAALVVEDGGEACEVDSDRALYDEQDAGGNVLTSILGADPTQCSYAGGNILASVSDDDLDAFADVCKADVWQSADAATCYTRDNTIRCLVFIWNKAGAAP